MTKTLRLHVLTVIPVFVLAAQSSIAEVLPDSLRSCIKISSDVERLACFDREVGRATSAASPLTPATPLTPEQKIGLSNARVQQLESNSPVPPPPAELQAHIVSTTSAGDGLQTFVLDNAQVWRQTQVKSDFRVRQGDAVTITSGALGSFWLSIDNHRSTRVKRVR